MGLGWGGGGRAGSENDTPLPLTMTHVWIEKFGSKSLDRSVLAFKMYRPETLAAEKKRKKHSDKTHWEMHNQHIFNRRLMPLFSN